jgi:hypothetical protein
MAILTINHYINQANSFITDIRNNRNAYYMFAARSQPWTNGSGQNDDSINSVLPANNSVAQVEQSVYNDILYGKLLEDEDVSNLIPRYNWTQGTVYDTYDQTDPNLYSKKFFVVTDKYEIYKCIDNNNGANSYVKPTLTSASGTFKTGDGYLWKYMYTVDATSNTKFTTTNYIPVSTNTVVQGNATPGSIDLIKITDGGQGYSVYETGYIQGVVNYDKIQLPNTSSSINDYYTNSSIYLKSGFGAGQIREIKASSGTSKQITVSTPFNTFARLDLANIQGTITTGYYAEQSYDIINYLYTQGYYNIGSTITQTDTGATGSVISANTTILQVTRNGSAVQFALGLPIVDTSQSGTSKLGTVSVGNVGSCNVAFVTSGGSGYSANATVTITAADLGSGAVANAQATTGKITNVNIQTAGSKYFVAPTLTIAPPSALFITANTVGVNNSANVIFLSTANSKFQVGDRLYYGVATGNTAINPLTPNTYYYVTFANTTSLALSATKSGSNINIEETRTTNPAESGHSLTGDTATAIIYCDNQIVFGSGTQLNDSANGYANGDYIRVGPNTANNIRRVANNVNTSLLIVTSPFNTLFTATSNSHFKMPVAAEPSSIQLTGVSGYISNTNLTSIKMDITNSALIGTYFTVGEKVDMTDSSRINQGANAIIAYSNSTTVILSGISGTWSANSGGIQFFVSGESSQQLSQIVSVTSNPNITIGSPTGIFKLNYPVLIRSSAGSTLSGNAVIIAQSTLPNDQTEYQIGPTIKVTGDGSNTVGIAIVNTATNSSYDIIGVNIVNPGSGYTQANISIYANTSHGSGAKASAIIAPINGHGYDAITELGGRYVGIDAIFDTISNESYGILGYGSYRKVGILQNPQYKDIKVTLTNFDRANFTLNTSSYSTTLGWTPGEVVLQSTTNAAGVVVYGNSSFLQLQNVKGTFNTGNNIHGYYSNSTANVVTFSTIYFPVGNSAEIVTESNSGAKGIITSAISNTVYFMSNVVGQFATNDVMYDSVVNAYATVSSIYTANGTKDVSIGFGTKFNQTARITLTAITGTFLDNEFVQQQVSLASGRVISSSYEKDLIITGISGGSITVGQTILDTTTNAYGICTFANTTYIKLTNVSQDLAFGTTHTINNGLGVTATVSSVLPVLVLNNVSDVSNFQVNNLITGITSGASATCNNYLLITNPDLVRDTGKLIYSESFTPVTRAPATKEEIKLVLKF